MVILEDNTIFIADSHFNTQRDILFQFLNRIIKGEIVVNQLFLMGDIFDFLSEEIEYFKKINSKIISLIHKISSFDIEVIYIEGNHDFNLSKIFSTITVIKRDNQPYKIKNRFGFILLSHGDIFISPFYNIFTKIIRNSYLLKFLNIIDFNYYLSKYIERRLKNKTICRKQKDFDSFSKIRVKKYNTKDLIIEGHYHQGYISKNYINIPSFCCDKKYLIYKNNKFNLIS
jgi:UDP-2,3-diacylglucosamine hydrolase